MGTEPPLRLSVNIPASRLDVFEFGQLTRSYPVSVGARGYQTPAGQYRVSRVVWNPWWHPPDSKWARGRKPTAPGPTNPMGRIKLQFANLLYIHGTTEEGRLGVPASHGCIRMSNSDLIELTRLVHEHTTPDLRGELLLRLEQNPEQTRTFDLRKPVPFAVTYNLVEIRNGALTIHPDVYRTKKDPSIKQQVIAALTKAGINVNAIDAERLEQITRRRNATRLTVALEKLVPGSGSLER
ncbi:MAG: L,D-transpeptidase [Gemmatimonadota bacterium]